MPEMIDLGPERADLGPESGVLGPERGLSSLWGRGMHKQTDVWKFTCVLQDIGPLGPLPKKNNEAGI